MLGPIFLRHALPDIMTGLRIALGFSFVLAISSEMIAANSGIGKLIFMYGENGAYAYMFAAIACGRGGRVRLRPDPARHQHTPACAGMSSAAEPGAGR